MATFEFTAEDIAMGTVLTPGWYPAEVMKVEDGIAKSSGNPKTTVTLKILEALSQSGETVNGVRVTTTFSPGAAGFARAFLNALGANVKVGSKLDLTQETAGGKKLEVMINNDQYNGRTTNKAVDYRPLS